MRTSLLILLISSSLFIPFAVQAEIPRIVSYQGKVTDSDGAMVLYGLYDMEFRIYDQETGDAALWSSGTLSIDVTGGMYSVLLGDGNPINLDFDEDYWLEAEIENDVQSPRLRLGSVGYAYMASGLVPGTLIEGSVTSGTHSAIKAVNTASSGTCYGAYFESASSSGRGVYGWASDPAGTTYGGKFENISTSGTGLYGKAYATMGTTYGGQFISVSSSGTGAYGEGPKYGVYGEATGTSGETFGVYGISASNEGRGVHGEAPQIGVCGKATATTGNAYGGTFDVGPDHAGGYGAGVLGRNLGTNGDENYGGLFISWGLTGTGVKGWALATEGQNCGIYGQSDSNQGRGVYGEATATSNTTTYGGRFESNSGYGRGVYGFASHTSGTTYGGKFDNSSTSGVGVAGYATATSGETYGGKFRSSAPDGYGVWGKAEATTGICFGGYFETASSSGTAVRGIATSTTGETWGLYGRTYSTTDGSRGVYGEATATTGTNYGGRFRSYGETGRGVYGRASHTSGATYGGKFDNNSSSGIAVAGYATATTGVVYGVYGRSYSSSDGSAGVYGRSSNDGDHDGATYGVYGRNDGLEDGFDAPPIGVYGYQSNTSSTTGYGGWFVSNAVDGRGVRAKATSTSGGIGVSARGGGAGGEFVATSSGDWAFVAFSSHKILGGGSVNFVQNHPHNDDEVVVYAAPEGDEVATYTRGTARLVAGEAIIPLGETFKWVTNPDIGLTAHLTPRGDCEGLYVKTLTTDEMAVRECRGGTSDVVFDYIVYGLRIGFEEATVVQKKQKEAFIPSMADHREMYSADPYLKQYNALERFKAMHRAIGGKEDLDFTAARSLRDAVQMYDPAIHGEVGTDVALGSVGEHATRGLEEQPAHPQREREQAAIEENEWK